MANRRATLCAGVLALMLLLALTAQAAPPPARAPAGKSSSAKCEEAKNTLPGNPAIQNFVKCAGKKPITIECCRQLIPFAQYYTCLTDPTLENQVNFYLNGKTTVAEIKKYCLA